MKQKRFFSASWSITTVCNYNCNYCYRYTSSKIVDFSTAKKIVDKLYNAGCRKLSLAGGEPLLWHSKKDVFNLIQYIKRKDMITEIITNGAYLEVRDLYKLRNKLDVLTIDIDSLDIDTQIKMGRPKNHISHSLKLQKLAYQLGIKIKINTVATAINYSNITEMCSYIKDNNYYRWKVYQYMPIEKFTLKEKKLIVNNNQFELLRKNIMDIFRNFDCQIVIENNEQMSNSYINIAPDGTVHTNKINENAEIIKKEIGNILELEISDILEYKYFDKDKFFHYHSVEGKMQNSNSVSRSCQYFI